MFVVREIENVVQHMSIVSKDRIMLVRHLHVELQTGTCTNHGINCSIYTLIKLIYL
jgi:hypothetical protein